MEPVDRHEVFVGLALVMLGMGNCAQVTGISGDAFSDSVSRFAPFGIHRLRAGGTVHRVSVERGQCGLGFVAVNSPTVASVVFAESVDRLSDNIDAGHSDTRRHIRPRGSWATWIRGMFFVMNAGASSTTTPESTMPSHRLFSSG